MIRRSFFQALAAALLPGSVTAAAKDVQPDCEPSARTLHSPAPIQDPEWLQKWRNIPKLEIFAKDLPYHEEPHRRDLGEVILRHISEGSPFTFGYTGGSEPGALRTVLPTLLFSPDHCPYRICCEDPTELPDPSETPIYLLDWMILKPQRPSPRSFRGSLRSGRTRRPSGDGSGEKRITTCGSQSISSLSFLPIRFFNRETPVPRSLS